MNYIFYKDKCKSVKRLKKDENAIFYLIDISTERKGPVYTIVKDIKDSIKEDSYEAEIMISYSEADLPFDIDARLPSHIVTNTYNRYYSIYPLICQMIAFNNFIDLWSMMIQSHIWIDYIRLYNSSICIHMDTDTKEKDIKKSFKKLRMDTQVSSVLDNDCIIISKNGDWIYVSYDEISKIYYEDSFDIDKIIIGVHNAETCYLLSLEEYLLFSQNIKVMIYIISPSGDDDEDPLCDTMMFESLIDILDGCLFTPQLILLDQLVYENPIELGIIIQYEDGHQVSLMVDQKETEFPENTCLFTILKRLLSLKL